MFGDALGLIFAADHEARDVLQEDQRDLALAGQFDEVRTLHGGLGEQHAVVGQDGDRIAPDTGEAADQGRAVQRLELLELRAVDGAGNDLAHVIGGADVVGMMPYRSSGSRAGSRGSRTSSGMGLTVFRWPTMSRTISSACSSFSAT